MKFVIIDEEKEIALYNALPQSVMQVIKSEVLLQRRLLGLITFIDTGVYLPIVVAILYPRYVYLCIAITVSSFVISLFIWKKISNLDILMKTKIPYLSSYLKDPYVGAFQQTVPHKVLFSFKKGKKVKQV
ncbi:hypothetical protein [Caldisericum exile]|uniref:Uncharacterized protein n=1 Tax=Caldisericum exile (strain DSM 21853 / NBRC 104410 / AZM16c01) TaxID=511051 RepID=A0A7U6GDK7_CALEA|nr:hypothetical protein [Caldisericum exile]BAL80380.1 hypothetical protein CSE_02540 [Caldisericum exile AZM16c01]